MLKRREMLVGAAAGVGVIVLTRPKTADASVIGFLFAMASFGLLIAGLVQEARERRAWQDHVNNGRNWRRRRKDRNSLDSQIASLTRQRDLLDRRGPRITDPADPRIDAHILFPAESGMGVKHSSETAAGLVASIDFDHLHRHARGLGGDLNENEAVAIGQHSSDTKGVALAPITGRRLPLELPSDVVAFDNLRDISGGPVAGHAWPLYSRSFKDQYDRVRTGFAVPRDHLTRHAFENMIEGFKPIERDAVRRGLDYAIVFA